MGVVVQVCKRKGKEVRPRESSSLLLEMSGCPGRCGPWGSPTGSRSEGHLSRCCRVVQAQTAL